MPVKGAKEFKKFKDGGSLTRKGAILAQCYECNGYADEDCLAKHCPLYQWSPFKKNVVLPIQSKRFMTSEHKKKMDQGRERYLLEQRKK